jgi:hypothetical protein
LLLAVGLLFGTDDERRDSQAADDVACGNAVEPVS